MPKPKNETGITDEYISLIRAEADESIRLLRELNTEAHRLNLPYEFTRKIKRLAEIWAPDAEMPEKLSS